MIRMTEGFDRYPPPRTSTDFLYRCQCGRNLHLDDATKDETRLAYVFHCFSCGGSTLIDSVVYERRLGVLFHRVFKIQWAGRFEILPPGVTSP